ncbi:hypothetical protein VTN96DRAFT_1604 [Rasamsonia emersonii]
MVAELAIVTPEVLRWIRHRALRLLLSRLDICKLHPCQRGGSVSMTMQHKLHSVDLRNEAQKNDVAISGGRNPTLLSV